MSHVQGHSKQPNPPEPAIKRALGHPKRLEIFGYLTRKGGAGEAELVGALGLTPPVVNYHLSVLRDAGLIVQIEGGDHGQSGLPYIAATSPNL
jgi:DNA-binding transcriptional ArsR family regulator